MSAASPTIPPPKSFVERHTETSVRFVLSFSRGNPILSMSAPRRLKALKLVTRLTTDNCHAFSPIGSLKHYVRANIYSLVFSFSLFPSPLLFLSSFPPLSVLVCVCVRVCFFQKKTAKSHTVATFSLLPLFVLPLDPHLIPFRSPSRTERRRHHRRIYSDSPRYIRAEKGLTAASIEVGMGRIFFPFLFYFPLLLTIGNVLK